MSKKLKNFIISIIIPVTIGGIIGLIVSNNINYNYLEKPFLAPPGFIFPIVWTVLYILMGVSYGLLKNRNLIDFDINLFYYLQLFVNALWPIIFFTFNLRLFAFIWILLLDILVITMVLKFYQKYKLSGLLQIPYLFWIIFATYLNLFIYLLNR